MNDHVLVFRMDFESFWLQPAGKFKFLVGVQIKKNLFPSFPWFYLFSMFFEMKSCAFLLLFPFVRGQIERWIDFI